MLGSVFAVVLALTPLQGPVLRVQTGAAQLVERETVRTVEPRSGAVALVERAAWVETGALAEVELCWRGQASVRVTGPSAFEVERDSGLALARFQVAEIEVRRGTLTLSIEGAGKLTLAPGALRARMLPGGAVELENRGAAVVELRREGERPLAIPAWGRVRVRAKAAGERARG